MSAVGLLFAAARFERLIRGDAASTDLSWIALLLDTGYSAGEWLATALLLIWLAIGGLFLLVALQPLWA